MSMFKKTTLTCPACAGAVPFDAAHSINADRRPDLRAKVIDQTLQSQVCPHCGQTFRLAPDLNFLDMGRGQWLAAHPLDAAARWKELEDRDRGVFESAYGPAAPAAARAIGARLTPRITFGWAGLREKVLLSELHLDDVTLELVKIAIIRGLDHSPLAQDTELRLVDANPETLHFVWFRVPSEEFVEGLQVPRSLYDEVTANTDGWAAIRSQFDGALFVDMNRLLIEGGADPAADSEAPATEAAPTASPGDEPEEDDEDEADSGKKPAKKKPKKSGASKKAAAKKTAPKKKKKKK